MKLWLFTLTISLGGHAYTWSTLPQFVTQATCHTRLQETIDNLVLKYGEFRIQQAECKQEP